MMEFIQIIAFAVSIVALRVVIESARDGKR
jgi:hypothetical protein